MRTRRTSANRDADALRSNMTALRLPFMLEHHQAFAQSAADKQWSHLDYLTADHHQPRLQAVGGHLQQRRRAHLGPAGPPAAPR